MLDPPIHDDSSAGARSDRADGVFDLRDHATGGGAVDTELLRGGRRQRWNELLIAIEHTRHVGQEQQLLRAQCAGDLACHRVGVEVERCRPRRSQRARSPG